MTEQMETMKQKHSAELDEQNKKIQAMEQELASANDLLKQARESNLESAICQLAPSAAVASRLIRSDLSLTELYSMYAKSSEELEMRNCEIEQLKLQLKSIIAEISESAPILENRTPITKK